MKIKRKIEIVVISDVHLGSTQCHAKHLLNYLNSIEPKKLILNGDILDISQFSKRYFPKSHLKVIKKIMTMTTDGVDVVYITGNHDEMIRKFTGTTIGNIRIVDKLVLELHGKHAWFFHGDVFDVSLQNAKWLAEFGSYGYHALNRLNQLVNWYLVNRGKERYSFSKKLKNNKKSAAKYSRIYEKVISNLAIENGYDYVICGHIHQPKMAYIETNHGKTIYLNSGDWVENFTALEYQFKRWKVYHYKKDKRSPFFIDNELKAKDNNRLIAAITIIDQTSK
ncbi:UDP-2,3-diacylglucosamine diphosphatase [Mariniflexile sp. AS56]|uniref:UDP-2,3-diacylglucosamine diphosphatase n=1 Tax=Mariniflexile sp. AS56 TaxID=3063957 RepID=UPI0026E94C9A|nr:UDP-2,3-diacylglucosamine diphosphatase [Mariniflexile sp. AS56]MDO7171265.1 UDP-2,3-diacylglucosamine diphosphatase [Mariniflexile sp. AS56]